MTLRIFPGGRIAPDVANTGKERRMSPISRKGAAFDRAEPLPPTRKNILPPTGVPGVTGDDTVAGQALG